MLPVAADGPVPLGCQVVWDPGLGMRPPPPVLAQARVPVVVTVQGLRAFRLDVDELFPTDAQRAAEHRLHDAVIAGWRSLAPRIAAVITGSRFVASETSRWLGVAPARIRVSPYGVDREVFRPDGPPPPLAQPYFLQVSTGEPGRKNTARVIEARARLDDASVVLALRHPSHAGGPGIVVLPDHLDDAMLARWYRGAVGLVFPSLYEGFGLPIVEAMASGCPVVTSVGSACEEVAGDAALLVDPRSVDAITHAMRRLATEPALRRQLGERGLARVARLGWDATAAEHLAILRAVAAGTAPPAMPEWTRVDSPG
jgi:glycosyltransferase involved in cell wall biosynthesis